MKIQKTISAIIEVNSEELQALLNICEVIRRCTDRDYSDKVVDDVTSYYDKNEMEQMAMFIRSIGSRDQYE